MLFKWIKKLKWKYSNSYARFHMVREAAQIRSLRGFSHIVKGKTASRVLQVFGRMKDQNREFEDVVRYREYVLTGNQMYNDLVVDFSDHFSVSYFSMYRERTKKIESIYPRLRYVIVADAYTYTHEAYKELNIVYLKEYDSPELAVNALEKFTVEPAKCVVPIQGAGI